MKSEFIRQISHEIRTPLNILSGFTQVLTTTGMELDDETKADVCRQILENTDRITGLVNKMLELSDANSQTVIERNDQVLAVQIAAEAADVCGIATAPHLNFDIHVSPEAETAKLTTNQASAVRALSLVLDNARKFTKPAEAHTRYDIPDDKKRATLRLEVKEMSLQFIVEDNGIGIPATEADRIFDEFVQLDSYYDGTGIGLTVARSLARRLGGDILLDTSYAPGACFVMTLPLECS
jgi:signal transduction histidine kinase